MNKTEKELVNELVIELQESLLRAQESQQKDNQPTDFAAGFANGIQTASLSLFAGAVVNLKEDKKIPEVFADMLKNASAMHQAGHILNSEEPECAGLNDAIRELVTFIAITSILDRLKEGGHD